MLVLRKGRATGAFVGAGRLFRLLASARQARGPGRLGRRRGKTQPAHKATERAPWERAVGISQLLEGAPLHSCDTAVRSD